MKFISRILNRGNRRYYSIKLNVTVENKESTFQDIYFDNGLITENGNYPSKKSIEEGIRLNIGIPYKNIWVKINYIQELNKEDYEDYYGLS